MTPWWRTWFARTSPRWTRHAPSSACATAASEVVGIAERIERPQKFVRERLALLELPGGAARSDRQRRGPARRGPGSAGTEQDPPRTPGGRRATCLTRPRTAGMSPPPGTTCRPTRYRSSSASCPTTTPSYRTACTSPGTATRSLVCRSTRRRRTHSIKLGEIQGVDIDSAEVRFGPELVEQARRAIGCVPLRGRLRASDRRRRRRWATGRRPDHPAPEARPRPTSRERRQQQRWQCRRHRSWRRGRRRRDRWTRAHRRR